jgi:dTDP-glucose pyrophosphorylase
MAGASRLCIVVSPGKSDILAYYGAKFEGAPIAYVVQSEPAGLCDAVLRALPVVGEGEAVLVGLPDTVWFPADALGTLGDADLELLLFEVDRPELFDAVTVDEAGRVLEIQVKQQGARSRSIWGAFKSSGRTLRELEALWIARGRRDVYLGTLFNAWIAAGGRARATPAGGAYVDVGTVDGYREAIRLLGAPRGPGAPPPGREGKSAGAAARETAR